MNVVANICEIPLRFKAGNVSVWILVNESGYRESSKVISVEAVSSYLAEHPHLVKAWLLYSDDKRVSSGWFLAERAADAFEVGHYPKGKTLSFSDRYRACAEFIIREVGSVSNREDPLQVSGDIVNTPRSGK